MSGAGSALVRRWADEILGAMGEDSFAVTPRGRGVVGVVDGEPPLGVETDADVSDLRPLLRAIGYKL